MTTSSTTSSPLHTPVQIGAWDLPNRMVMAPLTRCRASEGRVPNALMAEYYAQRASAGLILSEATSVDPMGVGYPDTPGIWSDEQVAGWKLVTEAVHAKGGRILLQLWHVGRISDPMYLDGKLPVAPSAIAPAGHPSLVRPIKPFVTPRALELDEIPAIIEAYRKGAENAKAAGFDGVEIHGANGYLLDQFLQDSTNQRNDSYGGSLENRARLTLEVVDAAISVWGADHVGLHIAPDCDAHDMGDSAPEATFGYISEAMRARGIAFIFARGQQTEGMVGTKLKAIFQGPFIANQQLSPEAAAELINKGIADACAWGQQFIANPDLVRKFKEGLALNEIDSDSFYSGGVKGYTDYPAAD
ncbi:MULTISPECIES: alkene reductase [unclassified Lentimonas]|uniref:alkene reductase n=1 Tax=unclassified Lentimonas TaxID=2630993 RepID=UPI0013210F46|nr:MULTISPECIES: alkene reductase [unclassified Lentimonas]CAA6677244.1 N-ethylmaleimide reductase (EC [Lentimonas sp. CC4]CAA6686131.1 N-ethylmaleimide reductase (EC [Lentimonas sp. CC6]CAA7074163.1 N-ethylmaleimide reductase (EC [Lentimonas sp. CC4]CAA7171521.1 N-ethylmaleimide reductase (EC [Lentimonas sp. CC21]CAA7181999.1 N-ethylmaleimide reductase (EC [Lentimonas sp. CC8]